jgi:uncharacterized protein with HEPN domain
MTGNRLPDYLDHILEAASDARGFTDGMSKDDFLADKRTKSAVVMSLIVIGEATTKILDRYPAFAARHPEIPWRDMRGMRNRIAHGYFEINFNVVWDAVQAALPDLITRIPTLRDEANRDGADPS